MADKSNLRYYLVTVFATLFVLGVISLGINVKMLQTDLEENIEVISTISSLRNDLSEYLSKPRSIDNIDTRKYFNYIESVNAKDKLNPEPLHEINFFLVNFTYSTPKKEVQDQINLINREIKRIRITLHDISARLENRWFLISIMGILACLFALATSFLTITFNKQADQVKIKNQELQKAKKEAELADKAKSDFVNIMSHEIRTPLNAVVGLSHILATTNPTEEQLKHIELLQFSSENLISLVNDVLDFGKIEAGKVILEEKSFDLHEHVRKIISTLEPHAKSKNLKLKLIIHNEFTSKVISDPTRLSQIIFNLCNNAIKFTEKGSVEVTIAGISETNTESTFKISIKDTGIGIEPEQRTKIFDRFSQANTNTSRIYGGSGLGLTISNRLLKIMGSNLILESEVNKGSVFWFQITLPKADESVVRLNPKTNAKIIQKEAIKVLIAEDNRINLIILEKLLQGLNIENDSAVNGQEAFDLATNNEYDLILMDLQMPIMDGFIASKKIAELKGKDKPTIIAISAANETNYIERLNESFIDDYITKPIDVDQFEAKLLKYIKKLS
ncbi:MAG: ATP-binding protein [Salibacteraceae bacterium]